MFWLLHCPSKVKIFLFVKKMFPCPFLACHWRRRSALVCGISFKEGVRRCLFERRCALMCRSSLISTTWLGRYVQHSGHDLFPERISAYPFPYYFDSSFSPHTFQASWPIPVFNPPEFLIMFNCLLDEDSRNFQRF
jgi:hypothetical protein